MKTILDNATNRGYFTLCARKNAKAPLSRSGFTVNVDKLPGRLPEYGAGCYVGPDLYRRPYHRKVAKWRLGVRYRIRVIPKPLPLKWRVRMPVVIPMHMRAELAERAIAIDDPEFNTLMLRLSLYDVEPEDITDQIAAQEARLTPGARS